jgi:hypothetical protein
LIPSIQVLEAIDFVKSKRDKVPVLVSIDPGTLSRALIELKDDVRTPEFREEPSLRFSLDFVREELIV